MRINGLFYLLTVLTTICLTSWTLAVGQEAKNETNWRAERSRLDREWGERLQDIANWARENGAEHQVPETFKLFQPRDLQRQYIFLPTEATMPQPPASIASDSIEAQWLTKINVAKVWQADQIFELAKRAANEKAPGPAFQFLNEVLHYNRDHAEVRKILGHRKTDDGWRVAPDRLRVRSAPRPHPICQWPAQGYLQVTTQHFEIDSTAGEAQTKHLAEQLERWHDVWRQVFFEYWCSPSNLQRWIDGKSSYRHSNKKFHVIFFSSQAEYVAQLAPKIKGIEASTGFYNDDQQVSFFYNDDADPNVEETWRHELTHQLFRESVNTDARNLEEQFIWLDEGIATYFESLADFGSHVTLGGFEARRVQFARIRRLYEGQYVPLAELSKVGRSGLQQRPDMARLYSQFAGVTDMLMNDHNGSHTSGLIDFLKLLYRGRTLKPGSFEKLVGAKFSELDERYPEYLVVDAAVVADHLSLPMTRTELSFSRAKLTDEAYQAIGECQRLNWLDLSQNQVSANQLAALKNCQQLNQLFLTQSPLEPSALKQLGQFPKLVDLDLSGSSVDDKLLMELQSVSSLRTLSLKATRVTDAGIARLKRVLPQLTVTR